MITTESKLATPYYLLDESKLLENMKKISYLREKSGAKSVLALKCFSTHSVFGLMREYMDGTTSSSLYEARLGQEKFGKEVHAYSVAWSEEEILQVKEFSTKILFNSLSQLEKFYPLVKDKTLGLRINPGVSHSGYDLANPNRKYTRLGISGKIEIDQFIDKISGVMFHCNCENDSIQSFSHILEHISKGYADLLHKVDWVSLGGGIYFTKHGYPLDELAQLLKDFSEKFQVQIYLEPGESSITNAGTLVTSVLDIVHNEIDIAIVDAAVETHMLDLMIYNTPAKVEIVGEGLYEYMVSGRTCLAGDIFGTYKFPEKLKIGSKIRFADAAGYTMVKMNWFNGIQLPSIVVKRLDGSLDLIKEFSYYDYINNLS